MRLTRSQLRGEVRTLEAQLTAARGEVDRLTADNYRLTRERDRARDDNIRLAHGHEATEARLAAFAAREVEGLMVRVDESGRDPIGSVVTLTYEDLS